MPLTHTAWGTVRTPQAAQSLHQLLNASPDITGQLIVGWPIMPPKPGQKADNAVIVSSQGQVTSVDLVDGLDPGAPDQYRDRQDRAFNILTGHLNLNPKLMHGRTTRVPVHTVTFAPESDRTDPDQPECPLVNSTGLVSKILEFQASPPWGVSPTEVLNAVLPAG